MNHMNPAEMTNEDLEKEAEKNKVTASKVHVKTAFEKENSNSKIVSNSFNDEIEQDYIIHSDKSDVDVHNGSIPDPEEIKNWENNEEDLNRK